MTVGTGIAIGLFALGFFIWKAADTVDDAVRYYVDNMRGE